MLDLLLTDQLYIGGVLALPVIVEDPSEPRLIADAGLRQDDCDELKAFLADVEHTGESGSLHVLPRPTRDPKRILLVGVGDADESGWRAAGSALTRAARREHSLTVAFPSGGSPQALHGLAEGILLAAYRYRMADDKPDEGTRLTSVTVICDHDPAYDKALSHARSVAEAIYLARDLTNTPSNHKVPCRLADRIVEAAGDRSGLTTEILDRQRLETDGFGGILATGQGSAHEPCLLRMSWDPPQSRDTVVVVGKGVTFDTGGINIKPRESMKLMRKDMGAASTVAATVICAAATNCPVRVIALLPFAENAIGADSFRPGDVVRHWGGMTSEIIDTDAEGRLLLADVLAYAAATYSPDYLIDLGTLTGAQSIALGKTTAALLSDNDALAEALIAAATTAGESLWRMPLVEDYVERVKGNSTDVVNLVEYGGAGCITAALYLREFTGSARSRWAHIDMSSPSWSDSASGELSKGATGWGVRTLIRWLETFGSDQETITNRQGSGNPIVGIS